MEQLNEYKDKTIFFSTFRSKHGRKSWWVWCTQTFLIKNTRSHKHKKVIKRTWKGLLSKFNFYSLNIPVKKIKDKPPNGWTYSQNLYISNKERWIQNIWRSYPSSVRKKIKKKWPTDRHHMDKCQMYYIKRKKVKLNRLHTEWFDL